MQHDPLPDNWGDGAIEELLSGLDPAVDCVVVGFDVNLSYVKLIKAATYLKKEECLFVATDRDPSFPISRGRTLPGSGAPVSAVATVAAREPTVVGKPSVAAFEAVARQFPQVAPGRTVIFGDRSRIEFLPKLCLAHKLEFSYSNFIYLFFFLRNRMSSGLGIVSDWHFFFFAFFLVIAADVVVPQ